MRTDHTTFGVLTLVLVLLVGGACGGDDDDGDTDAPADVEAPTTSAGTAGDGDGADSAAGDECRFVPTSAVQDVFGDAMELRSADRGCVFSDGELMLQLTYIEVQIDPEQYADEALESGCDEGTAVEVDAGDRAYACISFVGPLGNLYEGRDLVVINTSGVEDEAAENVRDGLADLLPAMTAD